MDNMDDYFVLYVEANTPGEWTMLNTYIDPLKAIQGFASELEYNRGAKNPLALKLETPKSKDKLRNHG